jgi:hypothetical protein
LATIAVPRKRAKKIKPIGPNSTKRHMKAIGNLMYQIILKFVSNDSVVL